MRTAKTGRMRRFLFVLALLCCIPLSASGPDPRLLLGPEARVKAEPVSLDARDPSRNRVGALTYLGGVALASPDPAFGGFSAMRLAGGRFTLVSDGGNVVSFRIGGDFRIRDAMFGDVSDGPGTGWNKPDRDVESLTFDPATGTTWLGYERDNAIWRYDATLQHVQRSARPAAIRDWPSNGGLESLVRLHNGRFVAISETGRPKSGKGRIALLFGGDPTEAPDRAIAFTYLPPAGFDPSDAVELPDGRLLVLNRRFAIHALFTAKLTLLDPRAIRAGATIEGREIAHFAAPLLHDNFEALAVAREGEDTVLWIAADDNQQLWERSLLLKFRLEL